MLLVFAKQVNSTLRALVTSTSGDILLIITEMDFWLFVDDLWGTVLSFGIQLELKKLNTARVLLGEWRPMRKLRGLDKLPPFKIVLTH